MIVGGRHLGAAGDPDVEIEATLGRRTLDAWTSPAGFFVRRIELPAGALRGAEGYVPIEITARPADGSGRGVKVGLEQFDLQSSLVPMFAYESGWQEPEYDPRIARAWRWLSEKAVLWVRPVGRDVTLRIEAESTRKYYDAPATIVVRVGGRELARIGTAQDVAQEVVIPAALLAGASGRVDLECDKWFTPAGPDQRHLAVRVYSVAVR